MDVFRTVNNRPNRISLFSKTRLNNSLTLRVKLLINIPLECGGGLNELDTLKANNAWQPKLFRTLWIILSSLSRLCNCNAILHGRVEAILSAFGSMKLDGNLHFRGSFINVTYCNKWEVMPEKVKCGLSSRAIYDLLVLDLYELHDGLKTNVMHLHSFIYLLVFIARDGGF